MNPSDVTCSILKSIICGQHCILDRKDVKLKTTVRGRTTWEALQQEFSSLKSMICYNFSPPLCWQKHQCGWKQGEGNKYKAKHCGEWRRSTLALCWLRSPKVDFEVLGEIGNTAHHTECTAKGSWGQKCFYTRKAISKWLHRHCANSHIHLTQTTS